MDAFLRGARQRRRQVVGQDLSRHVDQQRVLAQTRDQLQAQTMLQALERFFDAPTLVVERPEAVRRGKSSSRLDLHLSTLPEVGVALQI